MLLQLLNKSKVRLLGLLLIIFNFVLLPASAAGSGVIKADDKSKSVFTHDSFPSLSKSKNHTGQSSSDDVNGKENEKEENEDGSDEGGKHEQGSDDDDTDDDDDDDGNHFAKKQLALSSTLPNNKRNCTPIFFVSTHSFSHLPHVALYILYKELKAFIS